MDLHSVPSQSAGMEKATKNVLLRFAREMWDASRARSNAQL